MRRRALREGGTRPTHDGHLQVVLLVGERSGRPEPFAGGTGVPSVGDGDPLRYPLRVEVSQLHTSHTAPKFTEDGGEEKSGNQR